MDADPQKDGAGALVVAEPDDSEFVAACRAVINGSEKKVPTARAAASTDVSHPASRKVGVKKPAAPPTSDDQAARQRIVDKLEAYVEELRTSLADAQTQLTENAETLLQHEELRQVLASRKRRPARGRSESLSQLVNALIAEREAADSSAKAARGHAATARAETETVRAELESVRAELDEARRQHHESAAALDAAARREAEIRTELASAITANAGYDATFEQLRQTITERNQELLELQRHVLQAEAARSAEAEAFLTSLDQLRS